MTEIFVANQEPPNKPFRAQTIPPMPPIGDPGLPGIIDPAHAPVREPSPLPGDPGQPLPRPVPPVTVPQPTIIASSDGLP